MHSFCDENEIRNLQFVKCDTEGNDFRVIEGGLELLRGGRIDVFQFEYNHRWIHFRHYLKDVFDAIEGLPYQVCKITPDALVAFPCWHPELERFFEGNYALIHERAASALRLHQCSIDSSSTIV